MGIEKNTQAISRAVYQMLEDVLICSNKGSTSCPTTEIRPTTEIYSSPLLAATVHLIVGVLQINWMEMKWRLTTACCNFDDYLCVFPWYATLLLFIILTSV